MKIGRWAVIEFDDYASSLSKDDKQLVFDAVDMDSNCPIIFDGPIINKVSEGDFFRPRRAPERYVTLLRNALITGTGQIFTADGAALAGGSGRHSGTLPFLAPWSDLHLIKTAEDQYDAPQLNDPVEIDSAYAILHAAPGNYHHILIDILPRLHFLEQSSALDFVLNQNGGLPPVLINHHSHHILRYATELGLDQSRFISPPIKGSYRVKRLFVPHLLDTFNDWVSPEIHRFYAAAMEKLSVTGESSELGSRIFSLRRDFRGDRRRIHNVDEIANILLRNGFIEVFPEKMSWHDEMRAFNRATHIVGAMGSNMSNIIFCRPGARILSIQSNDSNFSLNAAMCSAGKQDIGYVFGEAFSNPTLGEHVEFYVDPTLVKRSVDALLSK